MAPLAAAAFSEFAPPAPRRASPSARRAEPVRLYALPDQAADLAAPVAKKAAEGRAAALYRLHGPIIYRRCLRLLRNPDAARDATQEVFLRLIRDEASLADREDLAPWLYRVATNHCLNMRRDARLHGETTLDESPEPVADRRGSGLDAIVVQRLLARFDLVTQAIAVAILVDEQEHEDVAAALGLSRRTMARKLDRFLELARRHLVLSGEVGPGERRG